MGGVDQSQTGNTTTERNVCRSFLAGFFFLLFPIDHQMSLKSAILMCPSDSFSGASCCRESHGRADRFSWRERREQQPEERRGGQRLDFGIQHRFYFSGLHLEVL